MQTKKSGTKLAPKSASKVAGSPDPLLLTLLDVQPRKGDLKKAEIIKAAVACIAEIGIEQTTFESIGKRIGMLRAHVAYHFDGKQEIIDRAIDYVVANAQRVTVEKIKKASNPREQLIAVVEAAFDWAFEFPEQADVLMLNFYYCRVFSGHLATHSRMRSMGRERLKSVLGALMQTSKPTASELEERALVVQSTITGLLVEFLTTEGSRTRARTDLFARLTTDAVFKTLGLKS